MDSYRENSDKSSLSANDPIVDLIESRHYNERRMDIRGNNQ